MTYAVNGIYVVIVHAHTHTHIQEGDSRCDHVFTGLARRGLVWCAMTPEGSRKRTIGQLREISAGHMKRTVPTRVTRFRSNSRHGRHIVLESSVGGSLSSARMSQAKRSCLTSSCSNMASWGFLGLHGASGPIWDHMRPYGAIWRPGASWSLLGLPGGEEGGQFSRRVELSSCRSGHKPKSI